MKEKIIFLLSFCCLMLAVSFSAFLMFFVFNYTNYKQNYEVYFNFECKEKEQQNLINSSGGLETENFESETKEEKNHELKSIGFFVVTAYCPCEKCCGVWADGITATGTKATQGKTIAVDPSLIELGSVVYFDGIDGFGGYVAEDTGGAIKENRIDIYFDNHQDALEWGVKEIEVFQILGE